MRELYSVLFFFILLISIIKGEAYAVNKLDSISDRISVYISSLDVVNRPAVIIFPGGGYHTLEMDREGEKVAKEFNKLGIVSFVLEYTLPSQLSGNNNSFVALIDAQNAIKYIRENVDKWGIDPQKIGVMGFSAGGHLAATLGTHFDFPLIDNPKNISLRPDFLLLIYPIISLMDSITHLGSRNNLVGKNPSPDLKYFFSNELLVNAETPMTFLIHASDDTVVKSENSKLFYNSLKKNGVNTYLKIYPKGEHGFLEQPKFKDWFKEVVNWMKMLNLL